MYKHLFFLTVSFIFLCNGALFGFDLPVSRITDDSLLRIRLKEQWMLESPVRVLSQGSRIELLETGERVQISTIQGREEFMVIFARELYRGTSLANRRAAGTFPGWAQGSWILTRRRDGAATQIRIYPRSDQNTHIQLRPLSEDKCQLDVVIYGGFVARSIPIAVPFERLYTMQINDILRLAENKIPLRYFEPDIASYAATRNFIAQVRPHLAGLRYADDGAIDENGNHVLIASLQEQNPQSSGLNCSGFIKWLIDGMLRPVTGRRLPIDPLKAPFGERGSSFTVNWEERRDVFFGLDWIRNLAAEANETLRALPNTRTSAYRRLEEFEVRSDNFSLIMLNQNSRGFVTHSYYGFLSEAGYGMEGLHPLLYTLAIDEPFSFYLAAVNSEINTPSSPGGTPRLRQYHHVAALVPYFDENGNFRIVVFESAAETSFTAFRNRYNRHHVNLVRIPVPPRFEP